MTRKTPSKTSIRTDLLPKLKVDPKKKHSTTHGIIVENIQINLKNTKIYISFEFDLTSNRKTSLAYIAILYAFLPYSYAMDERNER